MLPAIARQMADRAYMILDATFALLGQHWGDDTLRRVHAAEHVRLTAYLQVNLGFTRSVLDFHTKCLSRLHTDDAVRLPMSLSNFMSLLGQALPEYSNALAEPSRSEVRLATRRLLERISASYLDAVAPQVHGLAELLRRTEALVKNRTPEGKIVLPELPIGNSIPVKLLERHLRALGTPVSVIKVALSRNDTKRIGVTREQIIKETLSEASLDPGDILLYVDEWSTGANLGKISKIISKFARARGIRFIPIGLLVPHSQRHPDYGVHRQRHDSFAAAAGLNGDICRIHFDELKSGAAEPMPFFWSEHDRKSGYRKMQLLGSIFSSLDDVVERLAADRSARIRAYSYILESDGLLRDRRSLFRMARATWARAIHRAHRASIFLPQRMFKYVRALLRRVMPQETALAYLLEKEFQEGLLVYRQRRDDIMRVVHSSNTTPVEDVEEAIHELATLIEQTVGESSAERCMAIAVYFARYEGEVDPKDRYYFEEHVPLISELRGDALALHEVLMSQLADRVSRILSSKQG